MSDRIRPYGNVFAAALLALAMVWCAATYAPVFADDYRQIEGARYWDVAAPGANTDTITDITWGQEDTARVTVQVATSSVVNLMVSRGGTEKALGLNSNNALVAGAVYQFDVTGMVESDIVNIQSETDTVWDKVDVGALRPTR